MVDVEFLTQALQLMYGTDVPAVRRANTLGALRPLGRVGALPRLEAEELGEHYRFLCRVEATLRLLGARPPDTVPTSGLFLGRLARSLGYGGQTPARRFLDDYARRTQRVRTAYSRVFGLARQQLTG
jgi:glutamate-ammonia-ligase adenylyltransferase